VLYQSLHWQILSKQRHHIYSKKAFTQSKNIDLKARNNKNPIRKYLEGIHTLRKMDHKYLMIINKELF
jgi:hypothetical protein